jgi:hypothetical protein
MKAPVAQGGEFKIASSGARPAVLYQIIDLGTQEGSYEGKTTHKRKVRFQFELHGEEDKMDDGRPMSVGRDFTLSSHENATLRQFVEGWRSKSFTDEEAAEFDYKVLLGQPCILNITHDTSNSGKTYANIDSAMKLMTGMTPPKQVNPSLYFYLGEFDKALFDALPTWIQDKVKKSPEYGDVMNAVGGFYEEEAPFHDA